MSDIEEKIITSAAALFIEKGYKSTSMRDIGAAAEVNIAMLNYYFRSKERLFEIIFNRAFESMVSNIVPRISGAMSVLERVRRFIDVYTDALMHNPAIPGFIFHELSLNPSRIADKLHQNYQLFEVMQQFSADVEREVSEGSIRRETNPVSLLTNIVSMLLFPAIAKPIFKEVTGIEDIEYIKFLTNRKSEIYDVVESYLLLK